MVARRADPVADARVPLSRDRVLRAAIGIADEGGIDSLTMRKLAQELGVEAMSLYYYVANKDDILTGLVHLVESEIDLPSGGADWKAAIRRSAISFHDALSRHSWATSLMMSPKRVSPARVRYMDSVLRRLREAGFSPETTYHAYHALDSHIMGSTLWEAGYSAVKEDVADLAQTLLRELPIDEYPYFAEHVEQHVTKSVRGSAFEFGLDLILESLEKIRDAESRRSVSTRRRTDRSPRRLGRPKRRGR